MNLISATLESCLLHTNEPSATLISSTLVVRILSFWVIFPARTKSTPISRPALRGSMFPPLKVETEKNGATSSRGDLAGALIRERVWITASLNPSPAESRPGSPVALKKGKTAIEGGLNHHARIGR